MRRKRAAALALRGAGTLQILRQIYLPMLVPVLMVLVSFQSVNLRNDYLWPIGLGLRRVMANSVPVPGITGMNIPFVFTVATVASIPTVVLFLFFQRYFVQGVQGFGVKG